MTSKQRKRGLFKFPTNKFGARMLLGFAVAVALLALFAKLAEDLMYLELNVFDTVVTNFIIGFQSITFTNIMILITQFGSAPVEIILLFIVGGYLLFKLKHTWDTIMLASCLAGAWLLNAALKVTFHRSRPDIRHLVEAGGYSFPSGHAMVSVAFYGMLGYLIWLNLKKQGKPCVYVLFLTGVFILLIGISRIYLGVHYPSDVVAGFSAGGTWLAACILGLHAIRYYKSKETHE